MQPLDMPAQAVHEVTGATVRDVVFQLLRAFDMRTVFGNPGSTELPMFRDFPDDFRYVLGLQESTVVGMADGFAQATRNASLVNLHSATGVGHAMGNIFTAYKNCTPMVITAGQQARSILPYAPFLYSDRATELPRPYVKWSCEPARAQDVPAAIARAYHVAMQAPCGPTLVSVPVDDWDQPMQEGCPLRQVSRRTAVDPQALRGLALALKDSRSPAFVVGAGVDRDGAWESVVALAEAQRALVWVAPLSARCSFPESHPLFAGFLPGSQERIVELLAPHDVVVVLGAPVFTYHVEGRGPHVAPGTRLFQIVDDPELAAWAPVGTAMVGHLDLAARSLLDQCPAARRAAPAGRRPAPLLAPGESISPGLLMQTLSRVRPPDSILVEESPSSRPIMQRHLPVDTPNSFFACASGGLGYAMPAAVGVALAEQAKGKDARKVICLVGDGSSMYSIQALWGASRLGLPIAFIVLNNGRYEALYRFAPEFGLTTAIGSDLPGLDFVALAQGQGCQAHRVGKPDDLERALRETLDASGPCLLEVEVA